MSRMGGGVFGPASRVQHAVRPCHARPLQPSWPIRSRDGEDRQVALCGVRLVEHAHLAAAVAFHAQEHDGNADNGASMASLVVGSGSSPRLAPTSACRSGTSGSSDVPEAETDC
jgi:hypothetical protein